MTGPTVLGLDLSLASTGLAVVADGAVSDVRLVTSPGKQKPPLAFTARRLEFMAREIEYWIRAEPSDLAVIESPSFGSKGGSGHERGALWWEVVRVLVEEELPIAMVAPSTRAKYGTGNGRSDKKEVVAAVRERYPGVEWPAKGKCDDIADAVLLAAMGSRLLGYPIEELPAKNLEAMTGMRGPEEVKAA